MRPAAARQALQNQTHLCTASGAAPGEANPRFAERIPHGVPRLERPRSAKRVRTLPRGAGEFCSEVRRQTPGCHWRGGCRDLANPEDSVLTEQVLNPGVERDGDLVKARDGGA